MTKIKLVEIKLDTLGNKTTVLLNINKQYIEKPIVEVINYLLAGNQIERTIVKDNDLFTFGALNKGFKDMTGTYCGEYGEWIEIIEYLGNNHWRCKCSCGAIKSIQGSQLRNHTTNSCGHTVMTDLTGKIFGYWRVNKYVGNQSYECTCTCGCNNTTKVIRRYHLESGATKSCGFKTTALKDLTNYKFNSWTVLSYNNAIHRWLCKCECGTLKYLTAQVIKRGITNNCGCKRKPNFYNLENTVFGQWTVKKEVPNYQFGRTYYLCECTCGRTQIVNSQHLIAGTSTSCGQCSKTDEQLAILHSAEAFRQFISESAKLINKPLSVFDIADLLDVTTSTIYRLLNKYDAWSYIDRYVSRSKFENDILTFVKTLAPEVQNNICILPNKQELDIYIPDKNLAIEANGTYWHSSFKKESNYHINKTRMCLDKGISLIHIFEYEWNNFEKQQKLKNLIKHRLGLTENIIYARNTVIKPISNSIATDFLNKYHLQNAINAEICYGLYYDDMLIEVMTFGKPRFTAKTDYELLRLCTKNDYMVVGGAAKLFNYFKKEHPEKSVLTYCDLSKFNGKVYEQLGMQFSGNSAPSYVYVDKHNNVLSRYQCTKQQLVINGYGAEEQTEEEIMFNRGFYKIYNCGNACYTYRT